MFASRPPATFAIALLLAACSSTTPERGAETLSQAPTGAPPTSHVIIVSIDGLRPDAIEAFGAKTLLRLMSEGAFTLRATTIVPSITLPSHTSMLTGVEPEVHGVLWNEKQMEEHGHIDTPTIFAAARDAGLITAAFFSKEKFAHLAVPSTLNHVYIPSNPLGRSHADNTIQRVKRYLERSRPNVLFVHLGEPDFVGHVFGWMSPPYRWAVRAADRELASLLRAADEAFGDTGYSLLVTSDHGGHGRDHGSDDPRDVLIPWIAWGESVIQGELDTAVRTVDTAATALWLLGLECADDLAGRVVVEAFEGAERAASAP